ncbi:MAG: hypothetical protein M3239_06920 [Thermoproteota archaeon]|nr:hypothetical protein [Thermoproteota archaeon]
MPRTSSVPPTTANGIFGGSSILIPTQINSSWKTTVSNIEGEPMGDLREATILTNPRK